MTEFFKANPEKAASKVSIDSIMMGCLFFVFSLIWMLNPKKFSPIVVMQLAFAIPLLFVSSLAYLKVGYRQENKYWDYLGWYTNTIGNAFVLNVIGVLIFQDYPLISFGYFGLISILMLIYTIINIATHPMRIGEKIFKFFFFFAFIFLFGIIPIII